MIARERNRLKMQKYRIKLRLVNPQLLQKQCKEGNWKQASILNQDRTQFTFIDYDRLYQIQQGKCALCGRHQSELSDSLCADHDHETHVIRGLLCRRCNSRINIFDDKCFTQKVSQYLRLKIVKEN